MRVIEKGIVNGKPTIIVEEVSFFGLIKKKTVFTATSNIVGKFYNWVKEPNKTIVPDNLSFQLDEWYAA